IVRSFWIKRSLLVRFILGAVSNLKRELGSCKNLGWNQRSVRHISAQRGCKLDNAVMNGYDYGALRLGAVCECNGVSRIESGRVLDAIAIAVQNLVNLSLGLACRHEC